MEPQEYSITTQGGHEISVTQYKSLSPNHKTLVLSSATGVLQGFYRKFAMHFATLGYMVYTFDYFGMGKSGSEIEQLKHNTSDLLSWGKVDQAAVVAHAKAIDPLSELILLTHSIGGQILGFNPNFEQIDKVVLVASQSGYWRYFKGIHQPKMWLFWHVLIPVSTIASAYFPGKKIGLFENLPKHMAQEWAKWGRQKNYMMHYGDSASHFFDKINVPLLSLSFPNDPFAPRKAVDWMTAQYKHAKIQRIHYVPHHAKSSKLGHFGYFKDSFKDELWTLTHKWINNN